MKHLRKFNEDISDMSFPNAKEAVETIDFYLKQWEDYGFDISRTDTFEIMQCDDIRYYFRVFPDDIPIQSKKIMKDDFIPRIECTITTRSSNVDKLRELYNQIKFLPTALLQNDLYSRMSFNDSENINCYIHLTVYSTPEDLDYVEQKVKFSKNWEDAKKRQNINK